MIRGRLADGNSQPLGASTLALAARGGGDGIGLGYNPVSNTYLADYQSQTNAETWGVEIAAAGAPGTQTQLSVSGTTQSVQPRAEGRAAAAQWLMVTSNGFRNIIAQVVGHGLTPPTGGGLAVGRGAARARARRQNRARTSSASTATGCRELAAQGYHRWLHNAKAGHRLYMRERQLAPPEHGWWSTTGTCTTAKPAANWVCVSGNWLPPWMAPASSCTTPKPASNFVCVNGNWLPGDTSGGTSSGTCSTIKPGPTWTCVKGNWLPPWY